MLTAIFSAPCSFAQPYPLTFPTHIQKNRETPSLYLTTTMVLLGHRTKFMQLNVRCQIMYTSFRVQ